MNAFYFKLIGILVFLNIGMSVKVAAQTVYITKTGEKYHLKNCRYLSRSAYAINLKEVRNNGYTVCSVCKPYEGSDNLPEVTKPTTDSLTENNTSDLKRCNALTKAGTRCKRETGNTSGKCWQHKK